MNKDPVTLALDASTTNCGFSLWRRDQYIAGRERKYAGSDPYRRILAMRQDVAQAAMETMSTIVVMEQPIYYKGHGIDTLIALSMTQGVMGVWCVEHRIRFETVYPSEVKAALGAPNTASKQTMIRLAEMYLSYQHKITGEHHADSIGVFVAFWNQTLAAECLRKEL